MISTVVNYNYLLKLQLVQTNTAQKAKITEEQLVNMLNAIQSHLETIEKNDSNNNNNNNNKV